MGHPLVSRLTRGMGRVALELRLDLKTVDGVLGDWMLEIRRFSKGIDIRGVVMGC